MDKYLTVKLTENQIRFLSDLVAEHTLEMQRWKATKPTNKELADSRIERNQKILDAFIAGVNE